MLYVGYTSWYLIWKTATGVKLLPYRMRLTIPCRLCLHRLRGVSDSHDALILEDGARRLASHLVNHRFNLDDAKVAAAKAGLLSRLIVKKDADSSLSFWRTMPDLEALRSLKIAGEWERLNRLKAANTEAFYYWYQANMLR